MAVDKPLVGILMGSKSDWETMKNASDTLARFGVAHECRVLSAHRTPGATVEYVGAAEARGIEVMIAAAGGAAHLAGVVAAHTLLPVLGVPMESASLKGLDSLLSTVQMPGGIPVGTLAIGKPGATNAALLAVAILAAEAPRAAREAPGLPRGADGEGAEGDASLKVLVVGGTRFLGHELAWRLVAAGHEVTLFNRGTLPDTLGTRVERLRGDRTTADFERLLSGRSFDAAVDFAAYDGTDGRRVAEVLGGRVSHYVVISTGQVYLVREGCPRPARESDYDGPVAAPARGRLRQGQWEYGVKKRALEDALARGLGEEPLPVDAAPHPDGERRAGPLPPPRALPLAHARRRPDPPARRRRPRDAPRLLGIGGEGDPGAAGPHRDVRAGLQPRPGRDADAARAADPRRGAPRERRPGSSTFPANASAPPASTRSSLSPFSGTWMSFLDPARAKAELGFRHEPLGSYLDKIVTSFLAHPPADPPPGYESRATERTLVGD